MIALCPLMALAVLGLTGGLRAVFLFARERNEMAARRAVGAEQTRRKPPASAKKVR